MHFLFQPWGTPGDVYPYVGIGVGLKKRGHRVTFITHTYFSPMLKRYGLEHADLDDLEGHRATVFHPDYWDPHRGILMGSDFLLGDSMRKQYAATERLFVPGETVAILTSMSYGALIFGETHDLPLILAHISPFLIPSVSRTGAQPIFDWVRRALVFRFMRLGMTRLIEFFYLDRRQPGPQINRFRAELGLPPVRRFLRWLHSRKQVMCLFPRWLAEPVPDDWPPVQFTGFPFFDEPNEPVPDDVLAFLDSGDPPIAFTPGSATTNLHYFFDAAVAACRVLNRRGLFMTRFAEQLPRTLPKTIMHVPFAPHSLILPRCAALVSHGGIGTVAQGLRAGIPQVVMPMSYDQPEHARRLAELNVARTLRPGRFKGPALAKLLSELLESKEVREQCRRLAATLINADPVRAACDQIEEFAGCRRNEDSNCV